MKGIGLALAAITGMVIAVGADLWIRKYRIVNKDGATTITNIVMVTTNTVWIYKTNWAELPDLYFHLIPVNFSFMTPTGMAQTSFNVPVLGKRLE